MILDSLQVQVYASGGCSNMGAFTNNRKRGGDYYKSPVSVTPPNPIDQSYGHISKKPRYSVDAELLKQESGPSASSRRFGARIPHYPEAKKGLPRVVLGPVRISRYQQSSSAKKNEFAASSKASSSDRLGALCQLFNKTRYVAMKSLKNVVVNEEASIEKQKGKEVIEIDSDEEEEKQDEVADDSSTEEIGMMNYAANRGQGVLVKSLELNVSMAKKEVRSLDSSVVTDSSNADAKLDDRETMALAPYDQPSNDLGIPPYKRLLGETKKYNDKLYRISINIDIYEKSFERLHLLRPHKKEEEIQDVIKECFSPLSEEEMSVVSRAFSNSNRRKVLVKHANSNIVITGEILQCLRPQAWLNDEVINLYFELLKEREKREPKKFLKCHFFNTFFYKKLISGRGGYNYSSVRRWTSMKKLGYTLLECDKIFVPIHKEIHWCLAVINKKDKKLQYLDSLKGRDTQVLHVLARYFADEAKDKCGMDIDTSSWEHDFVLDLPKQANGYDCGMFMIKYSDFYSRDVGLCFGQENMPYFRERTANEILKLKAE